MARRRVAARRPFARSICLIRHLLFVPAIGAVAVLAPQSAAAQDADAPLSGPAPDDTVTVGLGLAYVPDYEGSDDYRTAIGPGAIGSVGGFALTLAGNRASLDLVRNASGPGWDFQAGPIAVVNFNRSRSEEPTSDLQSLKRTSNAV